MQQTYRPIHVIRSGARVKFERLALPFSARILTLNHLFTCCDDHPSQRKVTFALARASSAMNTFVALAFSWEGGKEVGAARRRTEGTFVTKRWFEGV